MRLLISLTILLTLARASVADEPRAVIASFDYDSPGIKMLEEKVLAMYSKADINAQIKHYSMPRALAEAAAGRVDAVIGHPAGTETLVENLEPIGKELVVLRFAIFAKEDLPLDQYKIILARGMPYVEQELERKGINFITHADIETIAELLRLGRYNATIMNENNTDWAQKKVPGLHKVSDVVAEFPIIHFVSRKKPELIKKLKASIQ